MQKATFYHAGCSVCQSAEHQFAAALDPSKFTVEVVNFADAPQRIAEAEKAGVVSVPAFVIDGAAFHINFGASMAEVKGSK